MSKKETAEWRKIKVKRISSMGTCCKCLRFVDLDDCFWLPSAIRIIREEKYEVMDADIPLCKDCEKEWSKIEETE